MSLSGTLKVECINGISTCDDGWSRHIEIEVEYMKISETFAVEDVVGEYEQSDILDVIGKDAIISWLSIQGFSVNPE